MALDAFATHPCMGTMRRATVASALRVWHLVKHMQTWESHLRRLEHIYIKQDRPLMYTEIRADIKRLREWRERLDSIDPRRNRTDNVSVLQGDDRNKVSQSERQSINDTPVS